MTPWSPRRFSTLPTDPYSQYTDAANDRIAECRKISKYARRKGLDANPEMVNRKLRTWRNWYTGALATGYLKHLTGVKPISNSNYEIKE